MNKETRKEKIKLLTEEIRKGIYEVQSAHVASKIVDEYMKWRKEGNK